MGCGYFQNKTNRTKLTIDIQGIILYYPLYNERHKMYNTLLYIGLTLMAVGFVGWVVSICMERHYEVKLWELEQKRKAQNGQR